MSSLLDSIAPPCSASIFVEKDWEEECERALTAHPTLTFAGALALVGFGLVGAVTVFCTVGSVLLFYIAGLHLFG